MRKFRIERKNNGNYSKNKNGYRNMNKEKYTVDVCIWENLKQRKNKFIKKEGRDREKGIFFVVLFPQTRIWWALLANCFPSSHRLDSNILFHLGYEKDRENITDNRSWESKTADALKMKAYYILRTVSILYIKH